MCFSDCMFQCFENMDDIYIEYGSDFSDNLNAGIFLSADFECADICLSNTDTMCQLTLCKFFSFTHLS